MTLKVFLLNNNATEIMQPMIDKDGAWYERKREEEAWLPIKAKKD